MLRCPTNGCAATWKNDAKSREARAKHNSHTFTFAQSIRSIDINARRGFDPRGIRYLLRAVASASPMIVSAA